MMDRRIAQIIVVIGILVEGHRSMYQMLKSEYDFLDKKWPRPHTAAETGVLEQMNRVLVYLEKTMQRYGSLIESIRELSKPEIRSIQGDETIT